MSILKKLYNELFPTVPLDPVIHCQVYKSVGCGHVDGPLCNVSTCKITVNAEVTPNQIFIIHPKRHK